MVPEMQRGDTAWQTEAVARAYLTGVRGAIPLATTQLEILVRVVRTFQPHPRLWSLGHSDLLGRAWQRGDLYGRLP